MTILLLSMVGLKKELKAMRNNLVLKVRESVLLQGMGMSINNLLPHLNLRDTLMLIYLMAGLSKYSALN